MRLNDPLGGTGNTFDPCRWCGVAHHPMTACGLDDMRNEIERLRAELDQAREKIRLAARLLRLADGERTNFEKDMMS